MTPAGTRARGALWLSLGACVAAAFWTSEGVAPWDRDLHNAWHQYEYLAEGFLHGHACLSVEPPPELLRLSDPYDPGANAPYRLWDASLYRGKYYLYHGPTPALALMLPWRAATGRVLPQRLAVAAFASLGLAGLALLILGVRDRHFPGLSPAALGAILIVAFHASWLPVVLRRSALWELPVVSGVACLWWALYFLWRFHDSGGRARWAVAAGIALALLMGSRVTYVLGAGAVALLLFAPAGGPGPVAGRRRGAALAAAGIAALGGIGLLAYNRARFGSWSEFGMSYMLFGEDYRGIRFFNPAFIPFNAWIYLFSVPQLGPYFPFAHPFWTDSRPAGFVGYEEIYGVIFMMPVHLAGLFALGWAWAGRAARGAAAAALTIAAAAAATVLTGLLLFCWAWACSRYTAELLAGWTVVTSVGLMAVFGAEGALRPGRVVRALAVCASCWTVAGAWLASAEFRGFMQETNPRTYHALAHALDYPSLWWARAKGVRFGAVDLVLRIPGGQAGARTVLVASGRPQRVNQLVLEGADGGRVRLALVQNEHRVLETPELAVKGGRMHIRLDAPWLYPPTAHPYWDALDPAAARERQTLFSIAWDSGAVRVRSARSVDPVGFAPAALGPEQAGPGSPCVESASPAAPDP
jgi:hypothetical protein